MPSAADLRRILGTRAGVLIAGLIVVLGAGFVLLAIPARISPLNSLYLTLLDASGAAVTGASLPGPVKLAQVLLTFDGMAFLPVVTAAIVAARLSSSATRRQRQLSGHVIVAGLGTVGTRIVGQLHDLGIDACASSSARRTERRHSERRAPAPAGRWCR
ncbi:MAG: hypothetical protein ACRDOK_05145 [Streptosporangiaceae bacterium]